MLNLIATTNVVVVHKDLHPELIYLLAETLQEEHSGAGVFQRAGEFPTANDPEFEVAEEARDYYRNGPSFLHRYLPFWVVNLTKRAVAVLVTAFAMVIPLITYAPKLYQWLLHGYLTKLYRRLRAIERAMRTELTARQVEALQTDLEHINRAANLLPMRHSDAFFSLIIHIRLTRAELVSRLTAYTRRHARLARTSRGSLSARELRRALFHERAHAFGVVGVRPASRCRSRSRSSCARDVSSRQR